MTDELLTPPAVAWNPLTGRWISTRGVTFAKLQKSLLTGETKSVKRLLQVAALDEPLAKAKVKHTKETTPLAAPPPERSSQAPPRSKAHAPSSELPAATVKSALGDVDAETARFWRKHGF